MQAQAARRILRAREEGDEEAAWRMRERARRKQMATAALEGRGVGKLGLGLPNELFSASMKSNMYTHIYINIHSAKIDKRNKARG